MWLYVCLSMCSVRVFVCAWLFGVVCLIARLIVCLCGCSSA